MTVGEAGADVAAGGAGVHSGVSGSSLQSPQRNHESTFTFQFMRT